jgi:hypothetical protein
MNLNLTGNWKGTIEYGKEYGENAGEKIIFRSELNQHKNKFSGLSYDISGIGLNPEPADINGEIKGRKINFIKQYRIRHMLVGDEHKIDPTRKGPKILYTGIFNESTNSFEGNWTMSVAKKFFGLIPLNIKTTGIWKMKKK